MCCVYRQTHTRGLRGFRWETISIIAFAVFFCCVSMFVCVCVCFVSVQRNRLTFRCRRRRGLRACLCMRIYVYMRYRSVFSGANDIVFWSPRHLKKNQPSNENTHTHTLKPNTYSQCLNVLFIESSRTVLLQSVSSEMRWDRRRRRR